MSIVSKYLDEHKEVLLRENPGRNESWLENEHMRKFIGGLLDQISQSDTYTSEYIRKLARCPIFTVVTYQGYNINDIHSTPKNKIRKARIRIVVYMLILMMLWVKTKACTMVKYKRSRSLAFTVSRFLLSITTRLLQSRVL
jgi:hypothetical protein